jgi:MoaA/NifB/PqqE/SkfB family radical SAM enzyme
VDVTSLSSLIQNPAWELALDCALAGEEVAASTALGDTLGEAIGWRKAMHVVHTGAAQHAAVKCPQKIPVAVKCPVEQSPAPGSDMVTLWLELETRCNLACKFCYNYWKDGSSAAPVSLDAPEIIACLDNVFDHAPCSQVAVSGGEPLLRRDLETIIRHIKARGVPVVVTTNGTLLTRRRIETLLRAGVDSFQIPLLAAEAWLHDQLSGAPCWRKSIGAIIMAQEACASVVPVFVATSLNLAALGSVLRLAYLLCADQLVVNKFVPGGLGKINQDALLLRSNKTFCEELLRAHDDAERFGMRIVLGVPVALSPEFRTTSVNYASCPVKAGQTSFTIDASGNLKECNHSAAVLGNLRVQPFDALRRRSTNLSRAVREYDGIRLCQFDCG